MALVLMSGIGAYSAASSHLGVLALLIGTSVGVGLLLISLVTGYAASAHWAVAVIALIYIGSLYLRGVTFDPWSPLVAAGLLATAELTHWSLDSRLPAQDELQAHLLRGTVVAMIVSLALGLAAIIAAASAVDVRGVAPTVAASVAVLVALISLALLTWRGRTVDVHDSEDG